MSELLEGVLLSTGTLTTSQIILNIVMSLIIGIIIYVSYWSTHVGTIYSTKFNVSLVMLSIVTAIVMTVIQNNIALSLGTIGALSIVRFRTAIKDPRDTIYIFWSIASGLCCGVSCYQISIIGAIVIFVFLLIFGRIRNTERMLLIVKGNRIKEQEIESAIFLYFNSNVNLRVKNTTSDSIEIIYELSRKVYENSKKNNQSIIEILYKIDDIEYANLVCQNDEING